MTAIDTPPASPFTDHELAAWHGMLEVHARVTQQLDAQMQAEHGLSVSAYEVLMFLADAHEHRLRMADIAQRVLLSRSGCTRLVDRLVKLGYVTRRAADTDGRGLYAQLTDAGSDKAAAARHTHREGVRRYFLDHLSASDQIAVGDVWSRFLDRTPHDPLAAARPRSRAGRRRETSVSPRRLTAKLRT